MGEKTDRQDIKDKQMPCKTYLFFGITCPLGHTPVGGGGGRGRVQRDTQAGRQANRQTDRHRQTDRQDVIDEQTPFKTFIFFCLTCPSWLRAKWVRGGVGEYQREREERDREGRNRRTDAVSNRLLWPYLFQ